mmetsp:Transcript_15109/g.24867  ORF Transcript_15109/g.24867 Transcript_15109/m.24867 type:complete len:516 (-) Transcript_15109:589-2136(-)
MIPSQVAGDAIKLRGRFDVSLLSGTHFPLIASAMVSDQWISKMNFDRWHVFFASERCVPQDSPDNNFFVARERLFRYGGIPASQVHPIEVSYGAKLAASKYKETLRESAPLDLERGIPQFDLCLLGIGDDAHTAGLFPYHGALREETEWVLPILDAPTGPKERVTLTLPVLRNARNIAFVTCGSNKKSLVSRILKGQEPWGAQPAQLVTPTDGYLYWFIDADAAPVASIPPAPLPVSIPQQNGVVPEDAEITDVVFEVDGTPRRRLTVSHVASSSAALADFLGEYISVAANEAIERHGRFNLAIQASGVQFPLVADGIRSEDWSKEMSFDKWHLYFASERYVPQTDPQNTYRTAQEYLLSHVPIPPSQVHPIDTSLPIAQAAESFDKRLRSDAGLLDEKGVPAFDLVILGIGDDGHTAALFPSHPALDLKDTFVAAVTDAPTGPKGRLTLTLPVLNNARRVAFISSGLAKRFLVQSILNRDDPLAHLSMPITQVMPKSQKVDWFLDESAASLLES